MINTELFGKDPKVVKAINFARNVSVTKAPILIIGESGTGKKTLGALIHENSNRAGKPLLVVDCSEDKKTVENEILGHRDSASGKFYRGVLEAGNGGTVIFANLDSLEEEFQKKLHKILSELDDYEIDVRIITTTTKNLSKLVGSGRFYRGLYNFVAHTQITLPPLRERVEDIENIAKGLLAEACGEQEGHVPSVSQEALQKLLGHYWTHNVAELKSVILNSVTEMSSDTLTVDQLVIGEKKMISLSRDEEEDGVKLMSLKDAERLLIKKALIHTLENRTQAAKILGVSIRTLRNKINEYRNEGQSYFINLR